MTDLSKYLNPTPTMDCDNPAIQAQAEQITSGLSDPSMRAKALFYFVRDDIRYNIYSPFHLLEHYRASWVLERKEGYCVQKAVLLSALARAADIPARLGFADLKNHRMPDKLLNERGTNHIVYHSYSVLYVNGKWLKATPAFDRTMCQRQRLSTVEFDALHDAMFPPEDLDGNPFIEYTQDRGFFDDVPLDDVLKARTELYGVERIELWKRTYGELHR
jgi:transglutaminase-like putative cysteine protease